MKNVLIIDDEEWICSVLRDYLEDDGYTVRTAPTLEDARATIGKETLPDVVVVDLTLPDGDGMSFIREFRANSRTKEIPVILITAHTTERTNNAIGTDKPNDCILKPFGLKEFKQRLETQIQPRS